MKADARFFASEPSVRCSDLRFVGTPQWDQIDEIASAWLGRACLSVPSIRVGLCWALEHRGFARHRDHMLVPRYMGRCILNSLSRFAMPVEAPTADTRIALVVDQFGLRQDLSALRPEFERRGWFYIEDSPYGIGDAESPGPESLGRFIGLGKVLPVVQGALLLTENKPLRAHILRRRSDYSGWSWPVWLTMLMLRGRYSQEYSAAAEAAYEMYFAARGGNAWLRGNLFQVLKRIDSFTRESQKRILAIADAVGDCIQLPDLRQLGYLVPFLAGESLESARSIFRQCRIDDSVLHVDVNRNMLSPRYVKSLFIPVNPRIPSDTFNRLLNGLGSLARAGRIAAHAHQT